MKVYLLRINEERGVFYSESTDTDTPSQEESNSWIWKKYNNLQTLLSQAESGVGFRMRQVWEWLHKRTPLDENLLRSLRRAESINLYYSSTITQKEAQKSWNDYLSNRKRYHLIWCIINFIITPLTLSLAILPGPNIIGYWFTYRAICHVLALIGIKRAKQAPVQFYEVNSLELSLPDCKAHVEQISQTLGLRGLDSYIKCLINHPNRANYSKLVTP